MDIRTLMSILQPLFDLSQEVMETNFYFQTLLATRIQKTGKPVDQLTVGELQQLAKEATQECLAENNEETP